MYKFHRLAWVDIWPRLVQFWWLLKFYCPLVPPTSWKKQQLLNSIVIIENTWTNLEKSVSQSLRASKARSRSSLSFLLLVLLMLSCWFSTLFSSIEPISSSPPSTPEKSGPNSCKIFGIEGLQQWNKNLRYWGVVVRWVLALVLPLPSLQT